MADESTTVNSDTTDIVVEGNQPIDSPLPEVSNK